MIKKLMPFLSRHKKDVWLSVLCSTGESLFSLLIPLVMAAIIDKGIPESDLNYTLKMGGLMGAMGLIVVIIGVLSVKYSTRAGMGLGADLRSAAYEKLQTFTFKDIERFGTSSIITRLTGDVAAIQNATSQSIKTLVRAPSMMIFAIVLSFMISVRITLIFVAMLPLLIIAFVIVLGRIRPLYQNMQERTDRLNLATQENLIGMRLVKAFVRRDQQKQRFEKENEAVFEASDKAMGFSILTQPISNVILYAATIVMFWLGGKDVIGGELTVGELTSLSIYLAQILTRIAHIANTSIMLSRSAVSFRRITDMLDTEPDITDGETSAVNGGDIIFDHVSFRYGQEGGYVLQDINLKIKQGETIGIIGGTGSAKTTLVQLIPRLFDVSEGRVMVGGIDVRDYTLKALRDSVSIVLQQNVLFSGSIRDNLHWGDPDASDEEIEFACKAACATEFIDRFNDGYDSELGQGGCNVSGGQKQRLCIARAIIKKPKILILDDSTSAVDMATDAAIRHAFETELSGVTKLIIAQRTQSVENADRIIVLNDGQVSGVGTHEELLASNRIYREVYNLQQQGKEAV